MSVLLFACSVGAICDLVQGRRDAVVDSLRSSLETPLAYFSPVLLGFVFLALPQFLHDLGKVKLKPQLSLLRYMHIPGSVCNKVTKIELAESKSFLLLFKIDVIPADQMHFCFPLHNTVLIKNNKSFRFVTG